MRASLLCLLIAVACAAAFRISGSASLGRRGVAAGGSLNIRNPLSVIRGPGSQLRPGQHGGHRPGAGPHGGSRPGPGPQGGTRPGSPGHGGHSGGHQPSHHGKPGHHDHHHRLPIPCHHHRPHRTTTTTTTTTAASTSTTADATSTTESTTSTAASTTDSTTSATESSTAETTESTTAESTESTTAESTDSTTDSSTAASTEGTTDTTETATPPSGRRRRDISFSFSKSFPCFLGLGGGASGESSEEFGFGNRKRRDVKADEVASTQSTSPVPQKADTAAMSNDSDANSESQPTSQPAKHCTGKSPVKPRSEVAAPSISIPQFEGVRFLNGWRAAVAAVRQRLENEFGPDPKSGLEEASSRALDSSDPEGGLQRLAQTVRNIYEVVAENCPVFIVARFIRDEGRRVAQQILDLMPTINVSVAVSAGN